MRTKTINLTKKNQKKEEYLFISRKNSDERKLINEDALFHELKKIGFKRVFFEKISVDNQIKLSNSCKIMIGYHGAGLSNCAYMNKNTFLIEICNKFYPHPHFELFCKILKIRYKRFFCKKNYKNLDGVCNVTEILNYVTSIKKNAQS